MTSHSRRHRPSPSLPAARSISTDSPPAGPGTRATRTPGPPAPRPTGSSTKAGPKAMQNGSPRSSRPDQRQSRSAAVGHQAPAPASGRETARRRKAMPDGTDLSFPVHPAAEAFAMLPDDELQTLAEDIKAKGLYHPIVLSPDGTELVDGRNRLAACAIAGVEPRFDRLPKGADPRDYIVSANINRRDLTKGQKALALALIYPEAPDKGGRGKKRSAEIAEVSATRVRQARTIISHPDLVDMVKSGSMKFD